MRIGKLDINFGNWPLTLFIAFLMFIIMYSFMGCGMVKTKAADPIKPTMTVTHVELDGKELSKEMASYRQSLESENEKLNKKITHLESELVQANQPPENFGVPKFSMNCIATTDADPDNMKMGVSIRIYTNKPLEDKDKKDFANMLPLTKDAYVPEMGGNLHLECK